MKIINTICRLATYVSMGIIALMMLLTVADVSLRYTLNHPIMGTIELTEFMMICSVLGMAQCALQNRHITVDVVTEHLSKKVNTLIEVIVLIPGMLLILILAWQGLVAGMFTLDFNVKSSLLQIPNFPFYVVLSISFVILSLAMCSLIVKRTAELIKG